MLHAAAADIRHLLYQLACMSCKLLAGRHASVDSAVWICSLTRLDALCCCHVANVVFCQFECLSGSSLLLARWRPLQLCASSSGKALC